MINTAKRQAPTNVRIPPDQKERLRTLAIAVGITPSDLIRAALREKLPEWETNGVVLRGGIEG